MHYCIYREIELPIKKSSLFVIIKKKQYLIHMPSNISTKLKSFYMDKQSLKMIF